MPFGFDELVLDMLAHGTPPRDYAFEGYWFDIGRPEDYDRANAEFGLIRGSLLREAKGAERMRMLVIGASGYLGAHVRSRAGPPGMDGGHGRPVRLSALGHLGSIARRSGPGRGRDRGRWLPTPW